MDELKENIPRYKINIVGIYDELFSNNKERLHEFCRRFKEFTETLPWEVKWGCQMRVDGIDDKLLETMKKSGCYLISYGFESYSLKVLKSMKKHINPELIHSAIHKTLNKGISIQANFIFGDTAETMETATETLTFWKEHLEAGIQLFSIMVCPNSELYQYCIKKGIIKDRLHFIKHDLYKCFNMTQMSNREFRKLQLITHIYNVKYSKYTTPLNRSSTSVKVRCPHCNEINEYHNYKIRGIFYKNKMYCRSCRKRFLCVDTFYKYYIKFTLFIAMKYRIDNMVGKLKSKLINKLKSYPIVWRLYQKKQLMIKKIRQNVDLNPILKS
jgi:radical SAM superfamily enzyme YgiQ (UPF0313 family)